MVETNIILLPRFRPEVRRLTELSTLVEEPVSPLPIFLSLVLVVIENDGTQIPDLVVVPISSVPKSGVGASVSR